MKKLILLRGLPGSGKTFIANKMKEDGAFVFSNDDIMTINGVYKWTEDGAIVAHNINQKKVCDAMRVGKSPIVVDNANILPYHMTPYIRLARHYEYEYEIRDMNTEWASDLKELENRNVHYVPHSVLDEMKKQYIHLPTRALMTLFNIEIPMDPEVSLREAQCYIEEGRFAKSDEAILDYEDWRRIGGFEPEGGDDTKESINNKLETWKLEKGICCG